MKKSDQDKKTTTVVVEADPQAVALGEAAFSADTERVLRMRTGLSVPEGAPLGNKLDAITDPAVRDKVAARLRLLEAAVMAEVAPVADEARTRRIIDALNAKEDQEVAEVSVTANGAALPDEER